MLGGRARAWTASCILQKGAGETNWSLFLDSLLLLLLLLLFPASGSFFSSSRPPPPPSLTIYVMASEMTSFISPCAAAESRRALSQPAFIAAPHGTHPDRRRDNRQTDRLMHCSVVNGHISRKTTLGGTTKYIGQNCISVSLLVIRLVSGKDKSPNVLPPLPVSAFLLKDLPEKHNFKFIFDIFCSNLDGLTHLQYP